MHKIKPSIEGVGIDTIYKEVRELEKISLTSKNKGKITELFQSIKYTLIKVIPTTWKIWIELNDTWNDFPNFGKNNIHKSGTLNLVRLWYWHQIGLLNCKSIFFIMENQGEFKFLL